MQPALFASASATVCAAGADGVDGDARPADRSPGAHYGIRAYRVESAQVVSATLESLE
jgi:hypothetical protein